VLSSTKQWRKMAEAYGNSSRASIVAGFRSCKAFISTLIGNKGNLRSFLTGEELVGTGTNFTGEFA